MGNFLYILSYLFSKFHKTKYMSYIKNLRHNSLHLTVFYMLLKFQNCTFNTKRDIDVKKIKVKNVFFELTVH